MSPEIDKGKEFRISLVDAEQIEALFSLAQPLPEKRVILHRRLSETTHTEINAILPGSYIRPHKDTNPSQAETFSVLSGTAELVTFGDNGEILQKVIVTKGMVAEVEANTWYTLVALTPFAMFELKSQPGGYEEGKDKIDAPWAPEEGTDEADIYFENLRQKLGLSEAS